MWNKSGNIWQRLYDALKAGLMSMDFIRLDGTNKKQKSPKFQDFFALLDYAGF